MDLPTLHPTPTQAIMFRSVLILALLPTSICMLCADDSVDPVRFESHVRSILKTHCFHCHGEEPDPESGLDLRLARLIARGGDSGPSIVPGDADASLLYQRLRDHEMPPDASKLLSAGEVQVIREWISAGAQTVRPEPDTLDESSFITAEEAAHWAYQPILRPEIPEVANTDRISNPIDAFILSRLEQAGLDMSERASDQSLLRRVYFDLHGLMPPPESIDTELDEQTWTRLVNELLDSHHYGERWGRHWLDVAGYADSEGYNDADIVRNDAWRYRDYVIRSLNSDKPFDQFVCEQLAGDEMITSEQDNLSAKDAELLTATGFLRMAPDGTGGSVADADQAKNDCVADTIKIVTSSLMAMTVGCAQCHDHRYDPISQVDYYRFRAVFEPAFNVSKWISPQKRRISLYTDALRSQAAEIEQQAKKIDAQRAERQAKYIAETFEKQLADIPAEQHDLARAAHQTSEKKRSAEQKALIKKYPKLNVTASSLYLYDRSADKDLKALAAKAKQLRGRKPEEGFVRAITEFHGEVPATHLFFRGDHEQPKQKVQPGGLSVVSLSSNVPAIPPESDELASTGRRLALAQRLTSRNHPLTARVISNRIWAHHFGRGLVTSVSDFGVLGQEPSHPKLLDWLATELMDHNWSMKHLHRLILTSSTWRQRASRSEALRIADPDNALFGGMNLLRLDAEVLRDCMLLASGELNRTVHGPAVPVMADRVGRFVIGKENLNAGRPGPVIDMKGEDLRRSIYIQIRRSRPLSVLEVFDLPPMTPNCDRRRPSVNSPQSLLMMNSDLVLKRSRAFASRLRRDCQTLQERIALAWRLTFARDPSTEESEWARTFIEDQSAAFANQKAYQPAGAKPPTRTADDEALALMCHMLFSSNEFLYIQ